MISFRYGSHRMDMGIKRTEDRRMNDVPSLDTRVLGALPKRKAYTSTHTIAPAFNKK